MNVKILAGLCVTVLLGATGVFVIVSGQPVRAICPDPGPMGVPCGNGDTDGDGKRDITDAVHVLDHSKTSLKGR